MVTTPDGSPITLWREYAFEPQSDITAFELAMILSKLQNGNIAEHAVIKNGVGDHTWDELEAQCPNIQRHFRLVR